MYIRKRISAFVFAMVMVFGLSTAAFAESDTAPDGRGKPKCSCDHCENKSHSSSKKHQHKQSKEDSKNDKSEKYSHDGMEPDKDHRDRKNKDDYIPHDWDDEAFEFDFESMAPGKDHRDRKNKDDYIPHDWGDEAFDFDFESMAPGKERRDRKNSKECFPYGWDDDGTFEFDFDSMKPDRGHHSWNHRTEDAYEYPEDIFTDGEIPEYWYGWGHDENGLETIDVADALLLPDADEQFAALTQQDAEADIVTPGAEEAVTAEVATEQPDKEPETAAEKTEELPVIDFNDEAAMQQLFEAFLQWMKENYSINA